MEISEQQDTASKINKLSYEMNVLTTEDNSQVRFVIDVFPKHDIKNGQDIANLLETVVDHMLVEQIDQLEMLFDQSTNENNPAST